MLFRCLAPSVASPGSVTLSVLKGHGSKKQLSTINKRGLWGLLIRVDGKNHFPFRLFARRTVSPELKSYALGVLFLLLRLLGMYHRFIPQV